MSLDPKALASLFEMSRDAVIGVENNRILFLNPAASSLFGAKPGDNAADHIPEHLLADPSEKFIASVQVNGQSGYASVSKSNAFSVISFVFPPTMQTESLSVSVREFAGTLSTMRLAMDILIRRTNAEDDESLRAYTEILYQNFYRMKRLCQHLGEADALKKGTLPFNPKLLAFDKLCSNLCDTLGHFADSLGVRLEFSAQRGHYYTLADATLLETMLLNLITNSIAHSPENGRIHMQLSLRDERIYLALDDEGGGMSSETLSQIMTDSLVPKTTDTAANAGLGLMITRGIVELHEGTLILESRENIGTKVRISLPLHLPEETEFRTPPTEYNSDSIDAILTELSVILNKKFYNKTMFD